tara:strand:+ start:531 stop:647 length:117 start_codon:yes stop_codon:yes gene_type:complete
MLWYTATSTAVAAATLVVEDEKEASMQYAVDCSLSLAC